MKQNKMYLTLYLGNSSIIELITELTDYLSKISSIDQLFLSILFDCQQVKMVKTLIFEYEEYYYLFQFQIMGACTQKQEGPKIAPSKSVRIEINCPICEESYDTHSRRPYNLCSNKHKCCLGCLSSMRNHASLKKIQKILCPYCKMEVRDDLIGTDPGTYKFLQAQLNILKQLPDNQKKLFAFSSIYLPSLHKFMTKKVKEGDNMKTIESIDMLRINVGGRMVKEYEVFEMEMLDCIKGLTKFYLNKNHIKAIDTTLYTQNKLQIIDLGKNKLENIRSVLSEAQGVFAFLKVLKLDSNSIEDLNGLDKFKYLQVLNISQNKFTQTKFLNNCLELKFINLQFNKISIIELYPNFANLYAIQLFGNDINEGEWQKFINFGWKELRLLTATVIAQNIINKYSAHRKIQKKMASSILKLIVFQMKDGNLQNLSELTQKIKNKKELLSKTRAVEVSTGNYTFFMENKGFLKQIIQNVLRYHPLGLNINFKPHPLNKAVYEEDDAGHIYKKISKDHQPKNYLFSSVLPTDATKVFIGFKSKPSQMIIGISQGPSLFKRYIQLDTGLDFFPKKQGLSKNEQVQIFISINFQGKFVTFICGEVTQKKFFTQRWEEYRFFVNIKEYGGEIKIIRNEIQII